MEPDDALADDVHPWLAFHQCSNRSGSVPNPGAVM
jgi:hypothetical protein